MALWLRSPDFEPNGEIPRELTCEGEDVSPALEWPAPAAGARSLALIVDDPDAPDPRAPRMIFSHWLLYNLPPDAAELPRAVGRAALPLGTREGKNDFGRLGYGGPCPPIGRHRYFHRLLALDVVLPDLGAPTRKQLLAATEGHVLETAELVGTYEKRGGGR
jgi:Raf kinase inhibitor-like YbhB/YbcL family protein